MPVCHKMDLAAASILAISLPDKTPSLPPSLPPAIGFAGAGISPRLPRRLYGGLLVMSFHAVYLYIYGPDHAVWHALLCYHP